MSVSLLDDNWGIIYLCKHTEELLRISEDIQEL